MCLTFVPKMKLIRLLVLEEFGNTQTHTDTHTEVQRLCAECGCLTINLLIKTTAKDGGHAPDPVMLVHSAV